MSCRVKGKVWLSPTRLCMALSGGQSTKAQQEVVDGFIVVESNYRVRPSSVSYNIADRQEDNLTIRGLTQILVSRFLLC